MEHDEEHCVLTNDQQHYRQRHNPTLMSSSTTATSKGSSKGIQWWIGLVQASIFSLIYFVAPFYILSCFAIVGYAPRSIASWIFASPLVLSMLLPPMAMPSILARLQPMLAYFDSYDIIREYDWTKDLIEEKNNYILACQPHGVLSFCGILAAVKSPPELQGKIPTAVADVLLRTPIMKHVMGIFGLISAGKKSLVETLKKTGAAGTVVLYIGGMAELFLSDENEELLYLKKRKGFIKLALQTGVDVIPVYLFGNTTVLSVMKHGILSTVSRKLGVSLTYMWGKYGLPIPRDCQLLYVSGKPLGIKHTPNPTQDDIDKFHDAYCKQVEYLFEKYKEKVPDYKHKKLHIK